MVLLRVFLVYLFSWEVIYDQPLAVGLINHEKEICQINKLQRQKKKINELQIA